MAADLWMVHSPAKINWMLRVIGRRDDGFHEIESLVSTVTLYDDLVFTLRSDPGFSLSCDCAGVPNDQRNLIWQAAMLLSERGGFELRWDCRLTKRIPAGGGLGGGSSNAAATLASLNRLSGLNWPVEQLLPLAAEIGSDVPLFLQGPAAIIRGRGERIEPAVLGWDGWVVLLMPGLEVPTPAVYQAWKRCRGDLEPGPVCPDLTGSARQWMQQTYNMLEPPACLVCPKLATLQQRFMELADRPVRISGSGSTLFTAFDQQSEAALFADRAERDQGVQTAVVRPIKSNMQDQRDPAMTGLMG